MPEFQPVSTIEELAALNCDDMLAGYYAGYRGEPEPDSTKSKGFWHGYRNGAVDAGRATIDEYQTSLARECVRYGYLKSHQ